MVNPRRRKITATEPRLIANGIANIRVLRTLIATDGRMAGRKTVLFVSIGRRRPSWGIQAICGQQVGKSIKGKVAGLHCEFLSHKAIPMGMLAASALPFELQSACAQDRCLQSHLQIIWAPVAMILSLSPEAICNDRGPVGRMFAIPTGEA
jgi:hypothetical protein